MRDKVTNLPLFSVLSVTLACAKCREDGKAADCAHMLHLVPRWQSGDRHVKLKTVMQDRPDLIESELSGLAFDSLQQVFRSADMDIMFSQQPPSWITNDPIHLFIDPAAGGPGSDYAILSVARQKGLITVRLALGLGPPGPAHESLRIPHRLGWLELPDEHPFRVPARAEPVLAVHHVVPIPLHAAPATELDGFRDPAQHHSARRQGRAVYIPTRMSRHEIGVLQTLGEIQQRDGLVLDPGRHDGLPQTLVQGARLVGA